MNVAGIWGCRKNSQMKHLHLEKVQFELEEMNALAAQGWRVIAVTSNESLQWTVKDTIVVTYERSM